MLERFTESKPIEAKEATVKRLAREMLERFRARFKRGEKIEHTEEPIPSPEPVAVEEVKIIAKEEEQEVATESQQPEEPETTEPSVSETKIEAKPPKKEREKNTDKGTFESIVTNNYFEGWDEELELEGNTGIKEKIRENIIQAEKRNQKAYEDAAVDLRISVEEFKARLQAKVEDMVERAGFFRATQLGVLEKIMNVDGRWKNQFETATSNGTLNPQYRAEQEMKMFGFNKTEDLEVPTDPDQYNYGDGELLKEVIEKDKERRPIYGYFSDDEHGGINSSNGKIPPPTSVNLYGTVNVRIKKERALKKATITFHDSLGSGSRWPPTPAAKPHFTSFRLSYHGGLVLNELKGPSVVNWEEDYTEVQYHNQLTIDDVESIHISTHNSIRPEDMEEVRRIFNKYKQQHPESAIQLIES